MGKIDVLLVGGGGREHALAWKLAQSPRIGKLYIAPGNGGTGLVGENVPIGAMEFEKLAQFAKEKQIGLTVCSMDDPLVGGIVDFFNVRGLRIWGPTKAAAQIEGSKSLSKQLMRDAHIPTASFEIFDSYERALAYARMAKLPLVVKASGLALGKGVYICSTLEEVEQALRAIMIDKVHKAAGAEVVIESFLEGPEVSIHALTDGQNVLMFPPSQDHKTALDGGKGKNTGGMGAIVPVPWLTPDILSTIEHSIVRRAIDTLFSRGVLFSGLLYPGLKMTLDGPKVLEFNARFGDPEAQAYMRLLKSDLLDLLEACVDSNVMAVSRTIDWHSGFAVNVVLASGGYPDEYKTGFPITGIEEAQTVESVVVFQAGTRFTSEGLVTSGGRVLGVSARGATLKEALDRAYEAIGRIHFEGMHFRRDIGAEALAYYSQRRV